MNNEDNRSNLLNSALALFAARGYDAAGVQEIVETVGVTKPTLYHYFGNKLGLLETLLEENFADLNGVFDIAAAYQGDVTLTLTQITAAYFRYAQAHRLFYRLQLSLWFAPPHSEAYRAVAKFQERQQQMLETLFLRAAEDHGNMRGRHRAYAATFLGMLNTYIGLALNDYIELDDELVYKAVHQFMHGIFS
jgi:AcrR family transcriptional regulator